jgi:hypothetical protein
LTTRGRRREEEEDFVQKCFGNFFLIVKKNVLGGLFAIFITS